MSNTLISIVIPAYNRPDTLYQAIMSCLEQAHRPLEILIGDDSTHDGVAQMLAALPVTPGVTIRSERHRPSRRQPGNVNWLFANAAGARLVLLHDDDLLLPNALETLKAVWDAHPGTACAFGKQVVILEDGAVDIRQTLAINALYFRADRPTGVLSPTASVGLLQQVPNNCYLLDTALARSVGYRPEPEVGFAADAEFGVRLALAMAMGDRHFTYADAYVSAYRIMQNSMMRTTARNQDHHLVYREVAALAVPPEAEPARALFLERHGPAAVLDAANAGDVALARAILASGHYGRSTASIHGLVTRLSLAWPRAGRRLRPWLKSGVLALRRLSDGLRTRAGVALTSPEAVAVLALAPAIERDAARRRAGFAALTRGRAAA